MSVRARVALLVLFASPLLGCFSPKKWAVDQLGDALAHGSGGWTSDDDPVLVGDATPFALKTIEGLLSASPKNRELLEAATSGFTSYSYAYVESEADYVEGKDRQSAKAMRVRAKKLYLRARAYGLRGLDAAHGGFSARLKEDPELALAPLRKEDVPLLYWTAASWAEAIEIDKTDAALASDLPLTARMMKRVIALDEAYGQGGAWDFFISYDAGLPEAAGGSLTRAKEDLDKAMALSGGRRAAPLVSYAEAASVARQDRKEFVTLLNQALSIDVDKNPDQRLPNLIAQKRARWLLGRADELFVE